MDELLPRLLDLPRVNQLLADALLQKALLLLAAGHGWRRKDEDCEH